MRLVVTLKKIALKTILAACGAFWRRLLFNAYQEKFFLHAKIWNDEGVEDIQTFKKGEMHV